jgi:putative peptidoglycan lipid II flippase
LEKSDNDQPVAAAAAHRRVFLRAAAVVAASVMLSRVLGFFRDWTLAHQVGSNAITDVYNAAFTIPDILNYLLAGGSFSITLIPIFLEYHAAKKEEAWRVFSIILSFTAVSVLALLIVAEVSAPMLAAWIAPGFSAEQLDLLAYLTRIMLPGQAFFLIGGVLMAVQYAQGRFAIPSLAPLIYNGMIIAFGALFAGRWGVQSFSWGVLAGSLLGNCLLQVWGARRLSAEFRFSLNVAHPGFQRYLRVTIPVMLGFSVIFLDDWLIRWFGSYLQAASITWLTYAKNLMRVPVAFFAQAAGVASFPILARLVAEKKWDQMHESLEDAMRHVILAIVPVSVLMALVSRPVVYLLYSRTRMGPADIEQTALAMEIFLAGAAAWATQAIIARGFYALGDTITPTVIGSGLTILSVPMYWLLSRQAEHLGLAAASSVAVIAYTAVLWVVLFRRLRIPLAGIGSYALRTALCAAAAGLAGLVIRGWTGSYWDWQSLGGSALDVAAISFAFIATFLASASVARILSWRELRGAFAYRKRA